MLNGKGNENGIHIKINRSNKQKTKLHVQHTFFSNKQKKKKNKFARAARFLSFFAVVLHNYNAVL